MENAECGIGRQGGASEQQQLIYQIGYHLQSMPIHRAFLPQKNAEIA